MVTTLEKETAAVELSPEPIYQLAMGFAATKTLLATQSLGLFQILADRPLTASELATQHHFSAEAVEKLLNACVSLKLCRKEKNRFSNTPLAERYLVPGRPGYLGGFLSHFNDHMYPAWFYLEDAVRSGRSQIQRIVGEQNDHFFQAIDRQAKDLETFMQTMEEHSQLEGAALAKIYDFSPHTELLDVGGGTGAMTVAILERYPHLRATVFDRPPVCEIADRNLKKRGLRERVRLVPGDFFVGPLPKTADVLLLSGILHNWSPENARRILARCADACLPDTTLLISEQVLNNAKTEPLPAALCSLNMLVMLDGAQEYSRAEFQELLSSNGFQLIEVRPTGGARQLLIARKR